MISIGQRRAYWAAALRCSSSGSSSRPPGRPQPRCSWGCRVCPRPATSCTSWIARRRPAPRSKRSCWPRQPGPRPRVTRRWRTSIARSRRGRPRSCASSSSRTCRARSVPWSMRWSRSRPTRSASTSCCRAPATSPTTTSISRLPPMPWSSASTCAAAGPPSRWRRLPFRQDTHAGAQTSRTATLPTKLGAME